MPTDYAPGEVTRGNVRQAWWMGLLTGVVMTAFVAYVMTLALAEIVLEKPTTYYVQGK